MKNNAKIKKTSKKIIAALLAVISIIPATAMMQSVSAANVPPAENRLVVNVPLDNYIINMDFDQDTVMAQNGDVVSKGSGKEFRIIDGTPYYVQYKKMNTGTVSTSKFSVIDDVAAITYPGALVIANTKLANGTPTPINDIDRCNNTLTISGITLKNGETASITVNPQEYGSVKDAIGTLVSRRAPGTDVAAKIQCGIETVYSEKQISAKLGVSSDIIDKLKLDLEAVKNGKQKTVLMNFQQIYYTVSAGAQKGSFAFADDVTVDELQRQGVNSQNPPAMISSVNYGRIVYVGVTTNDTSLDVKGALEAAYSNISGSISAEYKDILNKCSYTVFVLGGSAGEAGKYIKVNNYDDFTNLLAQDCAYTDNTIAAPISYTARFLKNGDLATSKCATDYIETIATPAKGLNIKLVVDGMNGRISYGKFRFTGKLLKGENADGSPVYENYDRTFTLGGTTESTITLPANFVLSTGSVRLSYKGWSADPFDNEVYNFSDNINSMTIRMKGTTTWYLGYTVDGDIKVNGSKVMSFTDA